MPCRRRHSGSDEGADKRCPGKDRGRDEGQPRNMKAAIN
jgi:hypothetical protein